MRRTRRASCYSSGVDPIDERDQRRRLAATAEEARRPTRRASVDAGPLRPRLPRRVVEPQRTEEARGAVDRQPWRTTAAGVWHAPIDSIEPAELLSALADLRKRVPETCDRVRQRLETIFDDAEFHKLCTGNPARAIRRKLAERPRGKAKGNFAALPYAEVPAFMRQLRQQSGVAARCLEFALLTAARTGEVLGCTWDEIDAQAGIWRIPGSRMKGGEEHVVYLCPGRWRSSIQCGCTRASLGIPFASRPREGDEQHGNARTAQAHGLRRQDHGARRVPRIVLIVANDTGAARPDAIEACLAHREADKVRASYNRAQFNDERKALLEAWANFLAHSAQIVPIRGAAAA